MSAPYRAEKVNRATRIYQEEVSINGRDIVVQSDKVQYTPPVRNDLEFWFIPRNKVNSFKKTYRHLMHKVLKGLVGNSNKNLYRQCFIKKYRDYGKQLRINRRSYEKRYYDEARRENENNENGEVEKQEAQQACDAEGGNREGGQDLQRQGGHGETSREIREIRAC